MLWNIRSKKAEIETAEAVNRDRTLTEQAWIQFKYNKRAMFGLAIIGVLLLIVVATVVIDIATSNAFYEDQVIRQNLRMKLKGPSLEHPLGCDEFGRDMLLRLLWGTRYSLLLGVCAVTIAMFVGGPLGMIAGFYGGKVDNYIMRVMDVFMACPFILMAMAIVAALGPSTVNLLIALGVSGMASFSRVTRAAVMAVKDKEFVESARAVGANDAVIMVKYILPNAMAPILVQLTLRIGTSILHVAGLSYIGLGVQPPAPEWGAILTAAKVYMRDAWHISVFPGLFLVITVVAFNLFGDGLRDALDPKLKR
ncbi:MAG: ABC transporter permease [Lachnospiraceae bacterium]|nr:ABC transporter permease [Lachnospiraceae bacterium]